MDSETELLVGRHENHEIEITSFEEDSCDLCRINGRIMINQKARCVLITIIVIIWCVLVQSLNCLLQIYFGEVELLGPEVNFFSRKLV